MSDWMKEEMDIAEEVASSGQIPHSASIAFQSHFTLQLRKSQRLVGTQSDSFYELL